MEGHPRPSPGAGERASRAAAACFFVAAALMAIAGLAEGEGLMLVSAACLAAAWFAFALQANRLAARRPGAAPRSGPATAERA